MSFGVRYANCLQGFHEFLVTETVVVDGINDQFRFFWAIAVLEQRLFRVDVPSSDHPSGTEQSIRRA